MTRRVTERAPTMVVCTAALVVLAPVVFGRGFVLIGDMSFVPFQPWKGEWLGIGGGPPRAVPADAIVSALTYVVSGELVQKAILVGSILLAGFGMLRILHGLPWQARLAGALLYTWNPYVYERLAIGHWGLLVGYGALPWILDAATQVRRSKPAAALPRLLLWLAVAAAGSPTGGLLAAATACVMVGRPARNLLRVLVAAVLVNLPWIVPGFTQPVTTSDPTGVRAFAASADTPLGLWGSVVGLGGIWKDSVAPAERTTWLLSGLAVLLSLVALATLLIASRKPALRATVAPDPARLLGLGLASLLVAGVPGTSVGATMLEWLVGRAAGAGLLRDSQKLLLPFVLVVCVGFALAVARVATRLRGDGRSAVPLTLALVPMMLLPSMAWGLGGRLASVQYPAEWTDVRGLLSDAGSEDDRMVVLPWSVYRAFSWNDHRAALDPAIRYFPGHVVTATELELDDRTVAGEDRLSAVIGDALRSGQPLDKLLRTHNVRWLLVEKGHRLAYSVPELPLRHEGEHLQLLEVLGATPHAESKGPEAWVVVTGHVVAALTVLVCGGLVAVRTLRRRSQRTR